MRHPIRQTQVKRDNSLVKFRACHALHVGAHVTHMVFGDTGCPEEGPLGLWVPYHPGIENLSSIESAARPKYELRFRHPDLRSHLRTKGTQECPVISVFVTCMQSLPLGMLPRVTFSSTGSLPTVNGHAASCVLAPPLH